MLTCSWETLWWGKQSWDPRQANVCKFSKNSNGAVSHEKSAFYLNNSWKVFYFDAFWMWGRRKTKKSIPIFSSLFFLHFLWKFSASKGFGALNILQSIFGSAWPGAKPRGNWRRGGLWESSPKVMWAKAALEVSQHSHLSVKWQFHLAHA